MVTRPYAWSTRASGIFSRQLLGVASTIIHWGLVLLLIGHVVGLIGGVLGSAAAVEFFFWSGLIGGILLIVGSSMALLRRIVSAQVRAMSRPEDYIVQCFLIAIVGIALYQVLVHRIFGITYTTSSWTASLWTLSPQPELMESASFLSKLHVFLALLFFAYFPFTKLVHFWTFPVNYLVRVPQSMRAQKYIFQHKWAFALRNDKLWLVYGLGLVAIGFLIAGGLLGSPKMAGGVNGAADSEIMSINSLSTRKLCMRFQISCVQVLGRARYQRLRSRSTEQCSLRGDSSLGLALKQCVSTMP